VGVLQRRQAPASGLGVQLGPAWGQLGPTEHGAGFPSTKYSWIWATLDTNLTLQPASCDNGSNVIYHTTQHKELVQQTPAPLAVNFRWFSRDQSFSGSGTPRPVGDKVKKLGVYCLTDADWLIYSQSLYRTRRHF
ncbi:hypothetical protein BaRGS_00017801, partial [Batillaria attramentaria]